MRLLLFDIDQTLIYTAGAGMRCLGRAVAEVAGIDIAQYPVRPDGKTDPAILEEILSAAGIDPLPIEAEIWRRYEQYLGDMLAQPDARRGVKPGVEPLLAALAADSRACLGLLTGNLQVTARVKLDAFSLTHYFPVGAYGSDSSDRNRLGPIALERARAHWGHPFEAADTWVIGDTDRDVQAARACGARVLAVATGSLTVEDLKATGADVVMEDLSETPTVVSLLMAT